MSEETKEPDAPTEVVRQLVVPPESQVKAEDGDRSPSKTERDLTTEIMAEAVEAAPGEVTVVRALVVPESASASEDGDRSPSKTERDLDGAAIAKTKAEPTQATETVRKLVIPEE